jgi:acetylglutamate kinase
VGLSGKDGGLILADKMHLVRPPLDEDMPPEIIDIGMVGRVLEINPGIIRTLETGGFIPVIAPVGVGASGETYNINADSVASSIAVALNATKLILLTDVQGVLDKNGVLISSMTAGTADSLIADGIVSGGMIPKMRCAMEAVEKGVERVHIIDGRNPHAVLLELFTDRGIGTEVKRTR